MDPLNERTRQLFALNYLVAHKSYVRENEVVPHFMSGSRYFMRKDRDGNLSVQSNACLHRGTKLVSERRTLPADAPVQCFRHGWKYDLTGKVEDTHGCDKLLQWGGDRLRNIVLAEAGQGFVFIEPSLSRGDKNALGSINQLFNFGLGLGLGVDLSSYVFDQEMIVMHTVGWESFMDVMLDDPWLVRSKTLGSTFDGGSVQETNGEDWTLRTYARKATLKPPITIGWRGYVEEVLRQDHGKSWFSAHATIYPGLTIELFPHAMAVNFIMPQSDKILAHWTQVYFAPEVTDNVNLQSAFVDAYLELAAERAALITLTDDGRTIDGKLNYSLGPRTKAHEHGGVNAINSWFDHVRHSLRYELRGEHK